MENYNYWSSDLNSEDYLEHYGTLGMKWHVRKYQYEDGSLTPEGRERYLKKRSFSKKHDITAICRKEDLKFKLAQMPKNAAINVGIQAAAAGGALAIAIPLMAIL